MKLGEDQWAIVKDDGTVARPGEYLSCFFSSLRAAEERIEYGGDYLRRINGTASLLRVVRVRLVAVEDAGAKVGAE